MSVRIGINPITWTNDDVPELGGDTPLEVCLAETREAGYLGTELDWSVGYGHDVYDGLTPSFTVQGGHLFVGPALQGPEGPQVVYHVMAIARLRW